MKNWLYNTHLIFSIGGGSIGAVTVTQPLFQNTQVTVFLILILVVFFSMYAFGVFAGLTFAKNRNETKLLKIYYSAQVPYLISPLVSYQFVSAAHVSANIHWVGIGANFHLGSIWSFTLFGPQKFAIGVNILAALLLLSLVKMNSKKSVVRTPEAAPPTS